MNCIEEIRKVNTKGQCMYRVSNIVLHSIVILDSKVQLKEAEAA